MFRNYPLALSYKEYIYIVSSLVGFAHWLNEPWPFRDFILLHAETCILIWFPPQGRYLSCCGVGQSVWQGLGWHEMLWQRMCDEFKEKGVIQFHGVRLRCCYVLHTFVKHYVWSFSGYVFGMAVTLNGLVSAAFASSQKFFSAWQHAKHAFIWPCPSYLFDLPMVASATTGPSHIRMASFAGCWLGWCATCVLLK